MKKKYLCFFCFSIFTLNIFSLDFTEQDAAYNTIRAAGMGGAITSVPIGMESLLYNPAGLSATIPERDEKLNISFTADSYFRPQYLFPILEGIRNSSEDFSSIIINTKELITSSGAGAATTFSLAYTPHTSDELKQKDTYAQWGFGFYGGISAYLNGKPFPLGTEGYLQLSLNIPIGYGFRIYKSSFISLDLGAILHPGVSIFKKLNGSDIDALIGGFVTVRELIANSIDNPYFTLPVDGGMILSFLDKPYTNAEIRLSVAVKNLFGDYFVPGENIEPLKKNIVVNTGSAFILPFKLFGLKCSGILSAEFYGINQIISGSSDFWKSIRTGAELSFGNVIFLRGGFASGYPAFSIELKIFLFSIGCSWQTIEAGRYIGDNPLSIFRLTGAIKLD